MKTIKQKILDKSDDIRVATDGTVYRIGRNGQWVREEGVLQSNGRRVRRLQRIRPYIKPSKYAR